METEAQQDKVLGGLISSEGEDFKKRINIVLKELGSDYFTDRRAKIFQILKRYYLLCLDKISWEKMREAFEVKKFSDEEIFEFQQLYEKLSDEKGEGFRFAIELLKEKTHTEKFVEILVGTMTVLTEGKKQGAKDLIGYEDSKDFLTTQLAQMDKMEGQAAPDGDINLDGDIVLDEYMASKRSEGLGLLTGFREIDGLTAGLKRGELALVAGYTGDCKTTVCINIAHYAAYKQGKNIVYGTGETLRTQVRRRLISLRSRDPKYNYREGISSKSLKFGDLTEREEEVLKVVLEDIKKGKYGKFFVFQFPYKASLEYIKNRLSIYQSEFDVDLVIIDEVRLIGTGRKRGQRWEELDDVIIGLKQLAVSFNNGRGVPVISPYQVKRVAWEEAIRGEGTYTKSCLANSAEAERSSDLIWSLFRMPLATGGDNREIRSSVIKYRDGEELSEFILECDLDKCYVGSRIGDSEFAF